MKLNAAQIDVEAEGFESTGFSLEVDDPAIIEILTQKIYTDPFVFPRELMANAIDSGGIAELILPDAMSPTWEVEDHGEGMHHDFMMTKYTKIFHSTKRKDDNNIGGFGHGRLSPLAYTDSYNVRSRFKGADGTIMEGNYVVYRGPNKVPQITCVSMEKSEVQQTGVRVSVPIVVRDIQTFADRTRYFAQYLTPTPPDITAVAYEFKGTTGGVRSTADRDRYDTSSVVAGTRLIIGGVPYPCPPGAGLGDVKLDLFFSIGELEVTLSRDAINATTDALQLIKDRFNTLKKEWQADYEAKLAAKPTLFETYEFHQETIGKMGYNFRSVFVPANLNVATMLESKEIFDQTKKDFTFHFISSDTNRSQWDGMDEETKAFRSLNQLRVHMLNDRAQIERRNGLEFSATPGIDFRTTFQNGYRYGGSSKNVHLLVFGVELPYNQGQIKKIKEVMAAKLAKYRASTSNASFINCILIQYTDKADVQKLVAKIKSNLDVTYIDSNASGAKATKYVSVTYWNGASVYRKALSEAVLAKEADGCLYMVKTNDPAKDQRMHDSLGYANSFPSLAGKKVFIFNKADEKYVPKNAKEFKAEIIKAIATDYGYSYDRQQWLTGQYKQQQLRGNTAYAALNYKVKGAHTFLIDYLAASLPHKTIIATLKTEIDNAKKSMNGPSHGNERNLCDIINSMVDYGILTKAELPAPTKTANAVTTNGLENALNSFAAKYPMVLWLTENYDARNWGVEKDIAAHIVTYIDKL